MFFERCFVLRLTCQSNRFPTDLKISNLGRSLRIFHPQQSPQAAQNGTCPRGCLCRCFLVDTLTQPTTSGCFHCWQLSIVARNELGSCKSKQDFSSSARLLQSFIRAFGVQTRLSIHKDQRLEIQRHIFYVQDAICSNFVIKNKLSPSKAACCWKQMSSRERNSKTPKGRPTGDGSCRGSNASNDLSNDSKIDDTLYIHLIF